MIAKILTTSISLLTANQLIINEMNSPDTKIYKPIDTVSIIVPSFNEASFIEQCLKSLRNQEIIKQYPDYFELIMIDSNSTDNTIQLATPYVDKLITTTLRGKLTARNLATLEAKGNIIVSVDADCYYNTYWLNTLLEPFNNINNTKTISGVVGSTYDSYMGVPLILRNFAEIVDRKILNPVQMIGRNSAYWKHIFYQTGIFNESINQVNIEEMVKEEERDFGIRISKIGNVIYKLNANCIHLGGQKIGCRSGRIRGNECKKYGIGIQRFG